MSVTDAIGAMGRVLKGNKGGAAALLDAAVWKKSDTELLTWLLWDCACNRAAAFVTDESPRAFCKVAPAAPVSNVAAAALSAGALCRRFWSIMLSYIGSPV